MSGPEVDRGVPRPDEAPGTVRVVRPVGGLDLSSPRRLHVVGVGGAGMSGIASVLARLGHVVSGSDLRDSAVLERLRLEGVDARVGHDGGRISADLDAVVVSTAVPAGNAEVVAARQAGVAVLRRADALAALTATRRTVAVSGTHGKTTTSSMVALVLRAAGWRPTFLIGGDLNEVGSNAGHDEGEWMVVEADESDGTFTELAAEAVVVTNVEPDHLDHHGSFAALEGAFARFLTAAPGPRVICLDDPGACRVAALAGVPVVTYGTDPAADVRIVDRVVDPPGSRFTLVRRGEVLGQVTLAVPGLHYARNAAGAAAVALELGVDAGDVLAALGRFAGVQRRLQLRGTSGGVTLVDSYAHLPTEVRADLAAARESNWARVVVVFQPHRYSRTEALWQDFGDAFDDADVVVLTDVYGAGEPPRPGVTGQLLLRAVLDRRPHALVAYVSHRADLARQVRALARPGDLVLTLGAGDVTLVADEWLRLDAEDTLGTAGSGTAAAGVAPAPNVGGSGAP